VKIARLAAASALAVVALSAAPVGLREAAAQPKGPNAAPPPAAPPPAGGGTEQRGVITLAEVTITGRIQKPIAAVDVSRIQPKLTLAELRQPFLDRIEKAVYKDPF
jgi:hypothetical protein